MKSLKSNTNITSFVATFLLVLSMIALSGLQPSLVNAQSNRTIDKNVENAILAEDWEKVLKLLDKVDTQTPSPVLRLIKGHACLATNRNNESLCLFLSALSEDDLKKWGDWSKEFVKKNSEKAVAHYFKGDSLARFEKWDGALMAFNKGLELHTNHPLVLNARGVTYAAKGKLANARLDFDEATKQSSFPIADAYANIGALCIQKKDGAKGAIKAFNRALEISPDFALALHGRGLVSLIVNKRNSAERDFERAMEMGACAVDLMAENRFRIAAYLVENKIIDGVNLNEVIADLRNPGMSLQKGYSDSSAYLNDMGNKATYSFAFSNALKSQNWGPFNGVKDLIANRWANNGFEKLERMSETGGAKAVTQWAEGPGGRGFKDMASATGRNIMNWKPTADMYANAFKTTGNMAMTTGLATSLAGGSGGALYGGGVAAMVISEGAAKSNTIHAQSVPIVQSGLDASKSFDNRSFQSPTTQSSRLPSGVDVSFEAVNWDVGEWPFIEYYGVLYGIKSKKMFLTSEGVKENKDVK